MSALEEYRRYCEMQCDMTSLTRKLADAAIAELLDRAESPRTCPFCGETLLHSSTIKVIEGYVQRAEQAEAALEYATTPTYLRCPSCEGVIEACPHCGYHWELTSDVLARHDAGGSE
jgi:hypothetical protein